MYQRPKRLLPAAVSAVPSGGLARDYSYAIGRQTIGAPSFFTPDRQVRIAYGDWSEEGGISSGILSGLNSMMNWFRPPPMIRIR